MNCTMRYGAALEVNVPCVGMFHNVSFRGETRRRYSGKLVARGKRPKNTKPAPNVRDLTMICKGMSAVARTLTISRESVTIVWLGTSHS